jgi:spore maturation protein CgeB
MRIVVFCHSLISDWNHGNAHFLRGVASELIARGHDVVVYEPHDGWSRQQLLADAGPSAVTAFHNAFPQLSPRVVDIDALHLDEALGGADVVIVHESSSHALVRRIGRHKARGARYVLLFHDTHHRSVTDVASMSRYELDAYDGVLAFGEVIRQGYVTIGWARRAWTWHEAADTRVFKPMPVEHPQGDVVWIGNWGDDERTRELRDYLIDPVRRLGLLATVHGVRYPDGAKHELTHAGIRYAGWLPNHSTPHAYARHRVTVHIPRRRYVEVLPGIPTIRVFEALACGIPLVSAAWRDEERLFTPGEDFLVANTPAEMRAHLSAVLADGEMRATLSRRGIEAIRQRHTCAHRVDELLAIVAEVRGGRAHPQEAVSV